MQLTLPPTTFHPILTLLTLLIPVTHTLPQTHYSTITLLPSPLFSTVTSYHPSPYPTATGSFSLYPTGSGFFYPTIGSSGFPILSASASASAFSNNSSNPNNNNNISLSYTLSYATTDIPLSTTLPFVSGSGFNNGSASEGPNATATATGVMTGLGKKRGVVHRMLQYRDCSKGGGGARCGGVHRRGGRAGRVG